VTLPRYEQHGLSFETPANWTDRSIVAFSAPPRGPAQPRASLVMARHPLAPGEDFAAHVAREVHGMLERAGNGRVLGQTRRTIGGRPAVETVMRWVTPGETIELTMVHVEPGPADDDPRVTVFTFTTAAGGSRAALDTLLFSLRFSDAQTPASVPAFDLAIVPMPGAPRARGR